MSKGQRGMCVTSASLLARVDLPPPVFPKTATFFTGAVACSARATEVPRSLGASCASFVVGRLGRRRRHLHHHGPGDEVVQRPSLLVEKEDEQLAPHPDLLRHVIG